MDIADTLSYLLYGLEPFMFHVIAFLINLVLVSVLYAYGVYLYKSEKRIKREKEYLKEHSENILSEANQKAMDIIVKSEYLSESIKAEIKLNFENVLKDLENENKQFYGSLVSEYEENSKKYVEKLTTEGSESIRNIAKEILESAKETEKQIQNTVKEQVLSAEKDISEYKESVKEEFRREMRQKVNKIVVEMLSGYIRQESQEKLINEAIEKAYKEKYI